MRATSSPTSAPGKSSLPLRPTSARSRHAPSEVGPLYTVTICRVTSTSQYPGAPAAA